MSTIIIAVCIGVIGAMLVERMLFRSRLQAQYERLEYCHDEHYQGMLLAGEKWAACDAALRELCDTIEFFGKARKASDLAASDLFDRDVENEDDWLDWIPSLFGKPYRKAMKVLEGDS